MKCKKCGYEWKIRTETPKECPRCKSRLDKKIFDVNHLQ